VAEEEQRRREYQRLQQVEVERGQGMFSLFCPADILHGDILHFPDCKMENVP